MDKNVRDIKLKKDEQEAHERGRLEAHHMIDAAQTVFLIVIKEDRSLDFLAMGCSSPFLLLGAIESFKQKILKMTEIPLDG